LFRQRGCQHGCLCGNFAAEASDQSEPLRKRMAEIFDDIRRRVVDCLKAAGRERRFGGLNRSVI